MEFCLPVPVQIALDSLTAAGHEAYLVGGCVRDVLRGVSPHDYDITTSARPEETLSVFSNYRTIETGLRHGTVTVLIDGMPLEITTYRVDGAYADHRRPDEVHFTSSLREDLARRDFTVNAMAYHPDYGLVDPFLGREDLKRGIIRAVGDPLKRFSEDALRILRALRFAARFDFEIEEKTHEAVFALADTLTMIAPERIREELLGILVADSALRVMREYAAILAVIAPKGRWSEAAARLPVKDPVLRLADFFLSAGEEAKDALLALRFDNKTVLAVSSVISLYESEITADRECICRLLRKVGIDALRAGFALRRAHGIDDGVATAMAEKIFDEKIPYTLAMLAIGGGDLAALGVPRGPRIGAILEEVYTAVIRGEVENKKESLLTYAEQYA